LGCDCLRAAGPPRAVGAEGFQGHGYDFTALGHTAGRAISYWVHASTQVSATAIKAHACSGLYALDAYGGTHLADSPPLGNSPQFATPLARAVRAAPGASTPQNGFILDAYGGLHPYGGPTLRPGITPYYPGYDIARDFVFLTNG